MMAFSGANTGEFLGGHEHSTPPPTDVTVVAPGTGPPTSLFAEKMVAWTEELGCS